MTISVGPHLILVILQGVILNNDVYMFTLN